MYVEQGTGARNKPAGAALRAQNYDLLAGSESITRCRQGKAFRQAAAVTGLPAGLSADFPFRPRFALSFLVDVRSTTFIGVCTNSAGMYSLQDKRRL